MALSPEDKKWMRRAIRDIVAEFMAEQEDVAAEGEPTQQGGYDGATAYVDDTWSDEGRRKRRLPRPPKHGRITIGFHHQPRPKA